MLSNHTAPLAGSTVHERALCGANAVLSFKRCRHLHFFILTFLVIRVSKRMPLSSVEAAVLGIEVPLEGGDHSEAGRKNLGRNGEMSSLGLGDG